MPPMAIAGPMVSNIEKGEANSAMMTALRESMTAGARRVGISCTMPANTVPRTTQGRAS